jgi:hypothetical protein
MANKADRRKDCIVKFLHLRQESEEGVVNEQLASPTRSMPKLTAAGAGLDEASEQRRRRQRQGRRPRSSCWCRNLTFQASPHSLPWLVS